MLTRVTKYPKDWKARSRFVRFIRARGCCERCGVRNYSVGHRNVKGRFIGARGSLLWDMAGDGLNEFGQPIKYCEARNYADHLNNEDFEGSQNYIVIVVKAAITKNNTDLTSLEALCQKCLNQHYAKQRRDQARINQLLLF